MGGRFHGSAEETELVAFGVGQDVPGLLAGLAHVGRAGAEGEEALEFLVLVAVDRVDVEVQGELGLPGVGAGAEDDGEPGIGRVVAGGADLDAAVLVRFQDDVVEYLTPEVRQGFGVRQSRINSVMRHAIAALYCRESGSGLSLTG